MENLLQNPETTENVTNSESQAQPVKLKTVTTSTMGKDVGNAKDSDDKFLKPFSTPRINPPKKIDSVTLAPPDVEVSKSCSKISGSNTGPPHIQVPDSDNTTSTSSEESLSKSEEYIKNIQKEKHEKYAAMLAQLKYRAPSNAQPFDSRYSIEILKNGTVVDNIKFRPENSFYVIGRMVNCDLVAEHPTLSRYHAIFQYFGNKPEPTSPEEPGYEGAGLYIYDLDSTHGTFINKNRVYPRRYYRLKVGHVVKFGNSSRLYIVMGPSEDEEKESDKTVSEILKERLNKELERKRLREQGIEEVDVDDDSGRGVDWGMGEDAVEEEVNLNINPFAKDFESIDLNLDNPKKTLRGWFEREGYNLVYDLKEKSPGHFVCRINLPLDGPGGTAVFAEADSKGKKKDVVLQAALQACQILDKYGVLRQSHHEGFKRKLKDWEEQDYYSSDEDSFLDRTGELDRKRKMRMKQAGKLKETTETFETLNKKYDDVGSEMEKLKLKIQEAESQRKTEEDDVDPLDAFMQDLKKGAPDIKKLRSKLKELNEEQNRLHKLIKIVKPTEPLELRSVSVPGGKDVKAQSSAALMKIKPELGLIPKTVENRSTEIQEQEVECRKDKELESNIPSPPPLLENKDTVDDNRPPREIKSTDSIDKPEDELPPPTKKKRHRQPNTSAKKDIPCEYDATNPDYSVWVPPEDQSGDGKISLNEKLGY